VAPPNPDVCEAGSTTGDVPDGLKVCATRFLSALLASLVEDGGSALPDAEAANALQQMDS